MLSPLHTERQVTHLILLVGNSPLPNAIAGRLLVKQQGRITLVHSAETSQVAHNLQQWLAQFDYTIQLINVPSRNAAAIYSAVAEQIDSPDVGLNYSGGTKAMAVHAQLAFRAKLGADAMARLSYLDSAESLMRFDDGATFSVALALTLDLENDLMRLHNGEDGAFRKQPKHTPVLPKTASAIAAIWNDRDDRDRWQSWRFARLKKFQLRRSKFIPATGIWQNWVNEQYLRDINLPFPAVVKQVMRAELVEHGYPADFDHLNIGRAYDCLYGDHIDTSVETFCEWLWGRWLEHHVLSCLKNISAETNLHEILLGVETEGTRFEMDVVAVRGYQLYAFSCSTSFKYDRLKMKLFEADVRARQLGGDEARVVLICTNNQPEKLQQEFRTMLNRRIKVFGLNTLSTLQADVRDWILGNA